MQLLPSNLSQIAAVVVQTRSSTPNRRGCKGSLSWKRSYFRDKEPHQKSRSLAFKDIKSVIHAQVSISYDMHQVFACPESPVRRH
jgi:hypothetical protein